MVPRGFVEDGFRLDSWVSVQRTQYARKKLSPERIARLEGVHGWAWNSRDDRWEEGFDPLRRFVEREGHARVPVAFVDDDDYSLGTWAAHQRVLYKKGTLEPGLAQRLQALPEWTWGPRVDAWEEGFDRLRRFVDREGHARVPVAFVDDDGYSLGTWVHKARARHASGKLAASRTKRLEEFPGWVWTAQREYK